MKGRLQLIVKEGVVEVEQMDLGFGLKNMMVSDSLKIYQWWNLAQSFSDRKHAGIQDASTKQRKESSFYFWLSFVKKITLYVFYLIVFTNHPFIL